MYLKGKRGVGIQGSQLGGAPRPCAAGLAQSRGDLGHPARRPAPAHSGGHPGAFVPDILYCTRSNSQDPLERLSVGSAASLPVGTGRRKSPTRQPPSPCALGLFAFFHQAKIPAVLEHPLTSRLWHTPEIQALARQANVSLVELDQCQFGATCKKPTRLMFCHVEGDDLHNLCRRCRGTRGMCSRSGRPHLQLEGSARTRPAAAYPPQLAHCIIRALTASSVASYGYNLSHP